MQKLFITLATFFFNIIFIAGSMHTTHHLSLVGKQMTNPFQVPHSQAYSTTSLSSFNFVDFATGDVPCCCSPRVGRLK